MDSDETQGEGDGRPGRLQHGVAQHLHAPGKGSHQDGKQDDDNEDSIQHEVPREMWRTGVIGAAESVCLGKELLVLQNKGVEGMPGHDGEVLFVVDQVGDR